MNYQILPYLSHMDQYTQAKEAAEWLNQHFKTDFKTCIMTGSGADSLLDAFELVKQLPFNQVPHLVSASYLKGAFISAKYKGQHVLIIQGRLHYYEGYTAQEITFPIRILKLLGIEQLIMTNASGGLNPSYASGELILVKDHINLMPEHPLRGANDERWGLRFPDMSQAYDQNLRAQLQQSAIKQTGRELQEGVYVGFQGPSLETPAEYKYLHIIGGDMVGMSTVPEVIVANHCGIQTAVLSIVTNLCYPPDKVTETTLEEVIAVAESTMDKVKAIILDFISK